MQEKLESLTLLHKTGLLDRAIQDYELYYKDKAYILEGLQKTILLYVRHLNEDLDAIEPGLEDKSARELLPILKTQLEEQLKLI